MRTAIKAHKDPTYQLLLIQLPGLWKRLTVGDRAVKVYRTFARVAKGHMLCQGFWPALPCKKESKAKKGLQTYYEGKMPSALFLYTIKI